MPFTLPRDKIKDMVEIVYNRNCVYQTAYHVIWEALQKPLFPSRIEQNRSVRFFFTTSKNGVFLPSK